ncbi:hypothetical protein J4E85_000327 [Alternaria conjuncta]|uniref:uncharacterized protein n=1 Tax=Alternaria conjuncta TaxID=181017 RepID=UPI00221F8291|nr:uncharacterized protein J4E85_000327 [Alternaria conjuncta]KAI4937890.1 hypothetical protein J4E85_000327 [Alternaria conjuncta]
MPSLTFHDMPTELVETIAAYVSDADLQSFRLTCRHADTKTLRVVGERLFSILQTNLKKSDIRRLESISRGGRLAKYVKTIRVQDYQEKPRGGEEPERLNPTHRLWSRKQARVLWVDKTVIAKLQTILEERHLSLDTLAIHNYYIKNAIALAREIIRGGGLVATSLRVSLFEKHAAFGTIVTLTLDRARQGEDVGFSLLRQVELQLPPLHPDGTPYFLLTQMFYHCADVSDDLRLKYRGQADSRIICILQQETPVVKLENLYLGHSGNPVGLIECHDWDVSCARVWTSPQ